METIGKGRGIAALFNARAKQFTPKAVRAMRTALPEALILVSEDLEQARRQSARIVEAKPDVVLAAGGDGSIVRLLNLLRETGGGVLPTVGILKMGTGNAWARVTGAREYYDHLKALPTMPRPLPTRRFDLVEVEGTACHFAGVGWDAMLINDYLRNLDKRSEQMLGSRVATRLHKGIFGYMYSLFRFTIPSEVAALWAHGQPRVTLENLGDEVFTLDSQAQPIPMFEPGRAGPPRHLFEGAIGVGGASSVRELGFEFVAFPYAQALPGFINIRIYDRDAIEATRNMPKLWRGEFPQPGMHDWFVKRARMTFSRPVPFQMAGDGLGMRESIEFSVADQPVNLVDWTAAAAQAQH